MANSSTNNAKQVEELLNLYKDTTVFVGNNDVSHHLDGNCIESIISPIRSARKSKRLLHKCTDRQIKVKLLNIDEDSKEEEEEGEVEVVSNKQEQRIGSFQQVNIEKAESYVDEDLREIYYTTHVIKVDPFADTNDSASEHNEINTCRIFKPNKRTPKVVFKLVPTNEPVVARPFKKRKVQVKSPRNETDKATQSNRFTTRSRTRPLQGKETAICTEKVINVFPTKITKSRSTKRKIRSRCHSKDEDSTDDAQKPFSCSKCDKSFKYPSALKSHTISHTDSKPYACDRCPSRFNQQSHLTRHLLSHKKNSKKFKCSSCEMAFRQRDYLQVHMRIHSGVKPYECEECGKSFSQKSHLNTHMKTHQEKELICSVCSKSFTLRHHLTHHLKYVHKKSKS